MASITIELLADQQARLEEIAEQRQLPVPECARALLAEAIRRVAQETAAGVESGTDGISGHDEAMGTDEGKVAVLTPASANEAQGIQRIEAASEAARLAAIDEAYGALAHVGASVVDLAQDRREEVDIEERRYRERFG